MKYKEFRKLLKELVIASDLTGHWEGFQKATKEANVTMSENLKNDLKDSVNRNSEESHKLFSEILEIVKPFLD